GIKGWYGGLNPLEAIGLTWLLGVVFFAGRLFYGTWQMRRITRRASRVDEAQLIRLGSNIEMHYDIERPVRIYVSERVSMPMTWGAIRPVVLLPQDALEWDDERLRAVLLHEYAHIKRWDWVTQSVGQLAVALHWFNPLAWMALKQLRREHERASDDQVLMAGLKASSYATHLLDIARTYWTAGWVARPTVAMARRSELEGRMLAILDPRRRRNVTRVALGAGLLVALGVLVPLSALELEPATAAEVEAMPLSSLMIEEVPPPPAPAMTESVSPEVNPEAWEAYGDKVCRTVDQLYAFDRNGEFNLSNINGNATFRPSKDAEAHVKAEVCAYAKERLSEVEVVIDASKDRIKVEVDYDDWNNDGRWSREDRYLRQPASVEFVVEVPASAELDVSLINGNLDAEGFTGKLELATINGRLTAERFSGPADLSAINGRLTADLSKVEAEKVSLSNVNGPIEATLADKPDVRLQASTVHGKIRSDFAIKVQTNKYSSSKSASASMGNGRTRLTMSNVNGPVSIRSASGRSYGGEMTVESGARAEYSDRKMNEQLRALESRMRAHQQLMTKHNRARGLERTELERQMRSLSAQQESMLRELWKQLDQARDANQDDRQLDRMERALRRLERERDSMERRMEASAKGGNDVGSLIDVLEDGKEGQRIQAVQELSRHRTEKARQALERALMKDRSEAVRMVSLQGIREHGSSRSVMTLERALAKDRSEAIRLVSLGELERLAKPTSRPVFETALLSDRSEAVRIRSARVLATFGNSEAIKSLEKAAEDDRSEGVRMEARRSIRALRGQAGSQSTSSSSSYSYSYNNGPTYTCENCTQCEWDQEICEGMALVTSEFAVAAAELGLVAAGKALNGVGTAIRSLQIDGSTISINGVDIDEWMEANVESEIDEAVAEIEAAVEELDIETQLEDLDFSFDEADTEEDIINAQLELLEVLAELPEKDAAPRLERIARDHPDQSVRKKARSLLRNLK
ncbi:MAG: M56 family metallopeptidase, partial [Bacteroidota bacterium]